MSSRQRGARVGSKLLPISLDYALCVCHLLPQAAWKTPHCPIPPSIPTECSFVIIVLAFLTVVVPSSTLRRCCNLPPLVDADPVSWSAPEEALTTGKVFAMLSVLFTVAFEVMLPNAAAIGA